MQSNLNLFSDIVLTDALGMAVSADTRYVVNLKDRGRLHKVRPTCLKLPRSRHRTCCGWRFGQVGALPTQLLTELTTIDKPCHRCFPRGLGDHAMPICQLDGDSIGQHIREDTKCHTEA